MACPAGHPKATTAAQDSSISSLKEHSPKLDHGSFQWPLPPPHLLCSRRTHGSNRRGLQCLCSHSEPIPNPFTGSLLPSSFPSPPPLPQVLLGPLLVSSTSSHLDISFYPWAWDSVLPFGHSTPVLSPFTSLPRALFCLPSAMGQGRIKPTGPTQDGIMSKVSKLCGLGLIQSGRSLGPILIPLSWCKPRVTAGDECGPSNSLAP